MNTPPWTHYRQSVNYCPLFILASYSWVKKYEAGGEEALRDGRGRTKAPEELTEADRHKLAMQKLEYENARLRAENAFLKKLEELEKRRR
ncbi:helix-turn-helix domain-containing protein [Paenibacillus sp. FSL R10-2791]|uniref:helix-turn-helix domain-containing protein n=1 Tax=Paenibacillus sp. FSL R10-2791 TaxID=2954695 RepID=UPI0030F78D61